MGKNGEKWGRGILEKKEKMGKLWGRRAPSQMVRNWGEIPTGGIGGVWDSILVFVPHEARH